MYIYGGPAFDFEIHSLNFKGPIYNEFFIESFNADKSSIARSDIISGLRYSHFKLSINVISAPLLFFAFRLLPKSRWRTNARCVYKSAGQPRHRSLPWSPRWASSAASIFEETERNAKHTIASSKSIHIFIKHYFYQYTSGSPTQLYNLCITSSKYLRRSFCG